MKPILFNTDMVRAILAGRKTCTRRSVKVRHGYPNFYKLHNNTDGAITGPRDRLYAGFYGDSQIFYIDGEKHIDALYYRSPYKPGDILYVRETWCDPSGTGYPIMYKADMPMHWDAEDTEIGIPIDLCAEDYKWRPSIHMPREAARIFLRVTDVRVERLQDIDAAGIRAEGLDTMAAFVGDMEIARAEFRNLWNSTIKPADLENYGWDANPWVWVILFERCEKPEEVDHER